MQREQACSAGDECRAGEGVQQAREYVARAREECSVVGEGIQWARERSV